MTRSRFAVWPRTAALSALALLILGLSPALAQPHPRWNPPGPRGGPGTTWLNPPGPRGGPGASRLPATRSAATLLADGAGPAPIGPTRQDQPVDREQVRSG